MQVLPPAQSAFKIPIIMYNVHMSFLDREGSYLLDREGEERV